MWNMFKLIFVLFCSYAASAQNTGLASLRRRLLERLSINRQFQQMAAPPSPSLDLTPQQTGIGNMLDSILSMRSQRPSQLSPKSNTQVLSRSSAIQNLQRRFGGHASSFSPDMGFKSPKKETSMFGNVFKPRTTPAAPSPPNVQISVSRSISSGGGLAQNLMKQAPANFRKAETGFPRSGSPFTSSNTNLISSRSPFQSSSAASSLSSPMRSSGVSPIGNVLSASNAINAAAATRSHISDMMDSRMDMLSDMAEAGMLGGFGGLGGLGAGGMFGTSGFGGGSNNLFGGLGSLAFM